MPIATPVLERLRQQIDTLEHRHSATVPVAKPVNQWLPQRGLPAGCIHEVKGAHLSNAIAFAGILAARLAGDEGQVLYLATDRRVHPLGLLPYGLKPQQILHVSAKRQQDLAWVALEALRCAQVSAVIGLIDGIDLKDSRRLQLAAEDSGATGFFLGHAASAPIASPVTRWRIAPYLSGDRQRRQAAAVRPTVVEGRPAVLPGRASGELDAGMARAGSSIVGSGGAGFATDADGYSEQNSGSVRTRRMRRHHALFFEFVLPGNR